METNSEEIESCPECLTLKLCIAYARLLLREDPTVRARLEASPKRVIHFVLDVRSLEGDLGTVKWSFGKKRFLTIADVRVEKPWAPLKPIIHVQASYRELREHLAEPEVRSSDDCQARQ